MKSMQMMWMMIFLVLPIVGLVYVLWHIWQLLPLPVMWRWVAVVAFLVLFMLMFVNFSGAIEKMSLNVASVVYDVGNSMIFILLYLVMLFVVLDLAHLVHIIPKTWLHDNAYTSLAVLVLMAMTFGYGNWHYHQKAKETINITTKKNISGAFAKDEIKMVMLSDLHLGYHNRKAEFARWVDMINREQPDLILIGGDIIDISVRPLIEERVAEEFHRLKAPVYACLGNHEYYCGDSYAEQFYKDAGITLLRDSVANLNGISIIGRDDRTNVHRKPLPQLMKDVADGNFTILLDHQPYHLEKAQKTGVDFQFSGHTHNGQVWPASWLTSTMYEDSFGYLRKGDTEYYVSSGMGIWGGKYRIGTRSEYVVATIRKS